MCAPNTQTYVHITWEYEIDTFDTLAVREDATSAVSQQLNSQGDGPLPHGHYGVQEAGLELTLDNANNHQTTWGVAAAAVQCLQEYMHDFLGIHGSPFAAVTFMVFDGPHQVGTGALQLI